MSENANEGEIAERGMFNVGDCVRLKSGGPVMTVEEAHCANAYGRTVKCVCFPTNDEPPRRGVFAASTLVLVYTVVGQDALDALAMLLTHLVEWSDK